MAAIEDVFSAGAAMVEAGIVPANCAEVTINLKAGGIVEITTKTYMESPDWCKTLDILVKAKKAGAWQERHDYVNEETTQRFTSGKPLTL